MHGVAITRRGILADSKSGTECMGSQDPGRECTGLSMWRISWGMIAGNGPVARNLHCGDAQVQVFLRMAVNALGAGSASL
jgi:hypothetical protein